MLDKVKTKVIEWYAKRWWKRAQEGKEGPAMQKLVLWIMAHKTDFGAIAGFLALYLSYMHGEGVPFFNQGWYEVTYKTLLFVAGPAVGSGLIKSDSYYKDKIKAQGQ